VSGTLDSVDWSAEFVRGDLEKTIRQLMESRVRRSYEPFVRDHAAIFSTMTLIVAVTYQPPLRGEVCLEVGIKSKLRAMRKGCLRAND
jgi:hypothetical protein